MRNLSIQRLIFYVFINTHTFILFVLKFSLLRQILAYYTEIKLSMLL